MSTPSSIWSSRTGTSLEVYLLGLVDYDAALELQERFVAELAERDDRQGVLLVCEHPPLVTIGRDGEGSWLAGEEQALRSRLIDVRRINRGGGGVVHAPGQLAILPIIPIQRCGLGLVDFRDRLQQSLLDVCGELHVPAWTRQDEPGVFCRGGQVAQIGLAVRSWISYHGMYLNVTPRQQWLELLRTRPERLTPATTLASQRQRPTPMPLVRESVVRNVAARLEYGRYHVYTGHPLLRRTRKVVAYA